MCVLTCEWDMGSGPGVGGVGRVRMAKLWTCFRIMGNPLSCSFSFWRWPLSLLIEMQRSGERVRSDLPEREDRRPNNPRSLSTPLSSVEPVLGSGKGWVASEGELGGQPEFLAKYVDWGHTDPSPQFP